VTAELQSAYIRHIARTPILYFIGGASAGNSSDYLNKAEFASGLYDDTRILFEKISVLGRRFFSLSAALFAVSSMQLVKLNSSSSAARDGGPVLCEIAVETTACADFESATSTSSAQQ
jgi:hypothetical protein